MKLIVKSTGVIQRRERALPYGREVDYYLVKELNLDPGNRGNGQSDD